MEYKILVADNAHYMDPEAEYEGGVFSTVEEVLVVAKRIVDDYLQSAYHPPMIALALYESYTTFGEDPFIVATGAERVSFSAWDYAKKRCAEICANAT